MIYSEDLINTLKKNKISFFTGVPDSVLKKLSIHLDTYSSKYHKMAVNEGSAVGIGIGHYLATKKLACVYLQNSGLGNAINPIISIAHKKFPIFGLQFHPESIESQHGHEILKNFISICES